MLSCPRKTPKASISKNRFNSSQWPIRKRLETVRWQLKRLKLKLRLMLIRELRLLLVSPKAAQEKDEYGIENELQTPENDQTRK